jgi:hypothetical protein
MYFSSVILECIIQYVVVKESELDIIVSYLAREKRRGGAAEPVRSLTAASPWQVQRH